VDTYSTCMGHKTCSEISGRGQGRLIVRKGEVNDKAEGTPIDLQEGGLKFLLQKMKDLQAMSLQERSRNWGIVIADNEQRQTLVLINGTGDQQNMSRGHIDMRRVTQRQHDVHKAGYIGSE